MERRIRISLTMFDLVKGLAMFFVLLRHSIPWDVGARPEWRALYSVLMPVFFVTGGFWLKPKDWRAGARAAAEQLLKPYLLCLAVIAGTGFVHRFITGGLEEWVQTFLLPGLLGMSGEGSRFGPLWFLLALFWAWTLFYLITAVKDVRGQTALAVFCGAAGGCLIGLRPPFQLAQGFIGAFWVYGGYRVKKEKLLEKPLRPAVFLAAAALWLGSVRFGSMDLAMYQVRGGFLSALGSLCGAFLVIKAALYANRWETRAFDGLRLAGRYTMWILCVHGVEGALVPWQAVGRLAGLEGAAGCVCWLLARSLLIGIVCAGLERIQKYRIRKKALV